MSPQHDTTGKGMFIVIEGTDGSGKGTQFEQLAERLVAAGHSVALFDFPQYDQPSSYFVGKYLNGGYGDVGQVGPYTGSLFYALDRYDAAPAIRQALQAGQIVLANRFTASNMAHQGTKFDSDEERRGYFIWLDNLEFDMLDIPRPDLNIVLRVPAETAQNLVDKKASRSYTDQKRDIHEADLDHLRKAVAVYDDLCALFPKDFSQIDCTTDGAMQTVEAIGRLIDERLAPLLPKPAYTAGQAPAASRQKPLATKTDDTSTASQPAVNEATKATVGPLHDGQQAAEPLVEKLPNGAFTITAAGRQWLDGAVSDVDGPVYATLGKLESLTAAAAMARLSRRGDDMRVTILDEFASAANKDNQLIQRVITAYGDDSVQQLVGQHLVVEDASQLLTKKIEWGRLAAYLEQSTRYIYYDTKDKHGKYRYVTPDYFDAATTHTYDTAMEQLFDNYSHLVRQLTDYVREHSSVPQAERDVAWKGATRAQACDAARAVLPVATKTTVGIFASGQALESMIMRLLSDELPEARQTGQRLLHEARKVVPAFLERADKPDRGGATIAYLGNTRQATASLAAQYLPSQHTASHDNPATLTDLWPRNELDIVADILYEHSDLPLDAIRAEVDQWPYTRKAEVFGAYIGERLNRRHKPGRALEKIHYSWDLVCDYGLFRELQRHRMVDDLAWQDLTPRLGYEVPKLVEAAGLTDLFEACFDLSLKLYSQLQQAGYQREAQYATLLGHRMRWKLTYNAREAFHLHELRTSPQAHPAARKLLQTMHQRVAEVHPLLAEAMRFVNQGEDPELTRLAAERYTQFKLSQLQQQPDA